mgnify:CR=1 FL=1
MTDGVSMKLIRALAVNEYLLDVFGDNETFKHLSVPELERLIKIIDKLQREVEPLRNIDPEYNNIYFDCLLMRCFAIAEQNFIMTGSFIKVT